ncbi:sporulation integral membrane protein YlbJ [Clostridium swellfunianum]|uniref:sporulation integral membrane protein YlbJ n=1 Tax=Clostridium swellfunianum TaxID=1367462 RepID=UPI00202EE3A4|nr:sporulation integral membrane protein YlbJ [Clostridium swellfunianum]MCM0648712.1 sporulation integral membrane protein YlbJ [Clostridium swellfunianum]
MRILLYLIIAVIIFLVFKLLKSLNKNLIITILCSLLIVEIVLRPKLCMDSALIGVNLFVSKVFPSLFPFLLITSLMMSYDGVHIYSKLFGSILCKPLRLPIQCTFSIVISIFCGYPLGAKYACELYEQGTIDNKTCQRLINIASNTSPLFAIGSVGTAMLGSSYIGYLLLLTNYISCLIMGFIIPVRSKAYKKYIPSNNDYGSKNIGNAIKDSVESSIKTCLSIGGFVIIYSVIISIIKSNILFDIAISKLSYYIGIETNLVEGTLLGFIEMTNGCFLISNTNVNMYIKAILISFLLAFSGFSIISQVHSFTYKHDLSMRTYIFRKFIQGIIGAAVAAVVFNVQIFSIPTSTFNYINQTRSSLLFICILLLMVVPYFLNKLKLLFHTS